MRNTPLIRPFTHKGVACIISAQHHHAHQCPAIDDDRTAIQSTGELAVRRQCLGADSISSDAMILCLAQSSSA